MPVYKEHWVIKIEIVVACPSSKNWLKDVNVNSRLKKNCINFIFYMEHCVINFLPIQI